MSTSPSSAASPVAPPAGSSDAASALRDAISAQIGHYLSPANLATDTFLSQRLNPNGTVPLSLLMTFPRLREICSDRETILGAMVLSPAFHVEHDTPNNEVYIGLTATPTASCSLAVKDVPAEFTHAELQTLTYQPIVRAVRNRANPTAWVLTFESETASMSAFKDIRTNAKFRNLAIRCYFKTDFTGHVPFDTAAAPYVPKSQTAGAFGVAGAPIRAAPYYPMHLMVGGGTTIMPSMAQMLQPPPNTPAPAYSSYGAAPPLPTAAAAYPVARDAGESSVSGSTPSVQGAAIRRAPFPSRGGRGGGRGAAPVAARSPAADDAATSDAVQQPTSPPSTASAPAPYAAALLRGIENRAVATVA